MAGSKSSNEPPDVCKSPRISADDSEDESEILEESPCGRWLKRREEVEQRDVPGIDVAYLAMDTEEGVEVVWNEVQFSERKKFKAQEEKIRQVFDNLIQLDHPNIVKFHKYWTDRESEKPRIIFITEYMSSGSLKQFLKKTKRNVKKLPLPAWKRWCTQILSALSYLHSCSPPVIHGNLTCDTIFIQHNGLVKIGSVAPDAIHHHVKTCRDDMKNMHFIAPEYGNSIVTPAVDIYSFGMCALEMAALEILGNGESGNVVTEENINKTIELIEDPLQKSFIRLCLEKNHLKRLSARDLLFQPIIYEIHPLKLIAAHAVNKNSRCMPENWTDEAVNAHYGKDKVICEIAHKDGRQGVEIRMSNSKVQEKLEKFMEDVRNGIYPLTAFGIQQSQLSRPRTVSPEIHESAKSETPELVDVETRRAVYMLCSLKPRDDGQGIWLTVLLRMEDKMNRQLTCELLETDSSYSLAEELVHYGFISDMDRQNLTAVIEDALRKRFCPEENRPFQIMVSQQVMNQQVVSQAVVPPPSGAQPSVTYMTPAHMTLQSAS